MAITIDKEEYLTSKEASLLAGRSVDTIGLWCRTGKIESRQDGAGRWLVKRVSLEKFIRGEGNNGSSSWRRSSKRK